MTKVCSSCKELKPLTREFFHKGKEYKGFRAICKECRNAYRRTYRFKKDATGSDNIEEFRLKVSNNKTLIEKYSKNVFKRAQSLYLAYVAMDSKKGLKCTLTIEDVITYTLQPCTYCKDTEEAIGCDRVDNTLGHTLENCVAACTTCNTSRMNNFSFSEMLQIGETIKKIKEQRKV